jgi:hypothetical protein
MTPLAKRLVAAVATLLGLGLLVLAVSIDWNPRATATAVILGAMLVVGASILALLANWFKQELAETNTPPDGYQDLGGDRR